MEIRKGSKNAVKYICKKCNFECSKKSNYEKHIMTSKHKSEKVGNDVSLYQCEECEKQFKTNSGLWKHKKKCTVQEPAEEEEPIGSSEDKLLIEQLMKSNNELKNMFVSVLQQFQVSQQQFQVSQQQNQENTKVLANTIVESMSKMGNTTNNNIDNRKITINQYLTETCVNAENIHDFTDRFVEGCGQFFENNWRKIDRGEVDFVGKTRDTFFKYLAENPQHMKFVQTTDVKRGVLYLKKKQSQMQSAMPATDSRIEEFSFVKYEDGFEWAGNYIQHRLLQKLVPLQTFAIDILKRECGNPPAEEDYSSERDYEEACDRYTTDKCNIGHRIMVQINGAYNFIDRKGNIAIMEKSKIQGDRGLCY